MIIIEEWYFGYIINILPKTWFANTNIVEDQSQKLLQSV